MKSAVSIAKTPTHACAAIKQAKSLRQVLLALFLVLLLGNSLNNALAVNSLASDRAASVPLSLGTNASPNTTPIIGQKDQLVTSLLVQSGINAQLAQVANLVLQERRFDNNNCQLDAAQLQRHVGWLSTELAAHKLQVRAAAEISTLIDSETRQATLHWFNSLAGGRIRKMEQGSIHIDDDQMSQQMVQYLGSERWTESRKRLIAEMLVETKTAEFVTAFNTGIITLVAVSEQCPVIADKSLVNMDSAAAEQDSNSLSGRSPNSSPNSSPGPSTPQSMDLIDQFDWNDPFISKVIASELVPVSATILRDVSDRHLQQLVSFSKSTHGGRFHKALVETTIRVLKSKVSEMRRNTAAGLRSAESSER